MKNEGEKIKCDHSRILIVFSVKGVENMTATSRSTSDAFSEKYSIYGDMIFKLSMVYLGNYADCEEVMQEVFIKLLYKAPQFESGEHEKSWLIRITINCCKDYVKNFWRKNIVSLETLEIASALPDEMELAEIILKLPYRYKAVIHLHYFEGYSTKEIAQLLHIGISAVKMRLKRGRELLKLEMEEIDYER